MNTYDVTTKWAIEHGGDDIVSDVDLETALGCVKWLKGWHDEKEIVISMNDGDTGTYITVEELEFLNKEIKKKARLVK